MGEVTVVKTAFFCFGYSSKIDVRIVNAKAQFRFTLEGLRSVSGAWVYLAWYTRTILTSLQPEVTSHSLV